MRGRKDCVWPIFRRRIFNFFLQRSTERNSQKTRNDLFFTVRSLSLRQNCIPANMSQLSLSCALAARDANERAKRERERSEVVVGRYAHHKFYFCRETDGQKKSCAQAAQSVRFFFSFFSAIILPPKQTMESFEQYIVYQSQDIFFVLFFSRFLPFKCSFYKYLRLCEWGDFLNAFYRR